MSSITYMLTIGIALVFGVMVFVMVRRGRMHEKYALLWLGAAVAVMLLALWPQTIDGLADFFHVQYAPSLLFFLAIMFCLGILLHLSLVVSRMAEQITRLAQESALLRQELEQGRLENKEEGQ